MKIAGSNPEPAAPAEPAPSDDLDFDADMGADMGAEPSANDKPFDDEPFDAGVEADEESDPKKYIEQLTGKLGQSLRKYNEEQGQPDFELEKFAINSLLSATHTSEMDAEDQKDIINKVKTAGEGDEDVAPESDEDMPMDEPMDEPTDEEDLEEYRVFENMDNLFVNPKKNNMFQPNSNDMLDESGGCWDGYERVTGTEKGAKGSCKKINEKSKGLWANIHAKKERGEAPAKPGDEDYPDKKQWNKLTKEGEEIGKSQNYMFWQNLKTIHHASGELLEMNQTQVDGMIANGHAWAVDHIATSSDDIEEVYHFFEANIGDSMGEFDGETEGGYSDEYGSVQKVAMNEAEYQGKTVQLGKPTKGDIKKFKVFVKNKKGNVIKVNFGDPNMEIKRDNPERKKSFRARHKCSQAKDRTTPKYWSCKMLSLIHI